MTQIIVQLNPDVPPTGSDLGIVNAARKSFGRRSDWDYAHPDGSRWSNLADAEYNFVDGDAVSTEFAKVIPVLKDKDKRLLEFLARGMTAADFDEFCNDVQANIREYLDGNKECVETLIEQMWDWRNTPTHDTPFNHGFFSFEVKAPVFVARHLVKHEYLIMSEYSRRYITDDVEFLTPEVWRKAAADVKQGSSDEEVTHVNGGCGHSGCCPPDGTLAVPVNELVEDTNETAMDTYETLITAGVAPEQARMVLPQSLMTSWTWSGTLGAFANMCKLRLSSDTQAETRVVAQAVYEELKKQFPVAAPLLVEGAL
jgi:thymidylate synthase (FAD)